MQVQRGKFYNGAFVGCVVAAIFQQFWHSRSSVDYVLTLLWDVLMDISIEAKTPQSSVKLIWKFSCIVIMSFTTIHLNTSHVYKFQLLLPICIRSLLDDLPNSTFFVHLRELHLFALHQVSVTIFFISLLVFPLAFTSF